MVLRMVPSVLNLTTTTGVTTVTLRHRDLALWSIRNVRLQGATPVTVALTSDGRTLVATFNKSALATLPAGNAVSVAATGEVERDGIVSPFTATTTVRILK